MLALAVSAVAVGAFALRSTSTARAASNDFMVELAFGLLLVGVVLITFNGVRLAPGVALCDAALAASALTTAVAAAFGAISLPVPRWLLAAAAGVLLAGILSAAFTEEVTGNLLPAFRFGVALLLTPLLVGALTGAGARRRDLVVLAWLASVSINAVVAISDFAGFTQIGEIAYPGNTSGRFNALTAHPNHLGLVCAMALPLALWGLLYRRRGPFGQLPFVAVLALLVSAIVLTGSRAAMIGAVAGAALLLTLVAQRGRAAMGVVVLGAAAAAVVSSITAQQSEEGAVLGRITGEVSVAQSDAGRFAAFRDAIDAFAANPLFGAGYEHVRSAHDIYLQLLEAGGLIALVSFLFFVVGSVRMANLVRRTRAIALPQRELATALLASLTVWFITGLTQNALYDRFLYLPAGLLLGFGVALLAARRPGVGPAP